MKSVLLGESEALTVMQSVSRAFLLLACFGVLDKDCMNRLRSLLSMRCMLLEYSFENRINSAAVQCRYSGLCYDRRFFSKRMLALPRHESIQTQPPSLLLDQEDDKIRLYSQGNCSKNVETVDQFRFIKILAWL